MLSKKTTDELTGKHSFTANIFWKRIEKKETHIKKDSSNNTCYFCSIFCEISINNTCYVINSWPKSLWTRNFHYAIVQLGKLRQERLSNSLKVTTAMTGVIYEDPHSSTESPLNCKEIRPVHPKGDQSWVFIGRTDAEAETPVLWLPHGKSWKRLWCWEGLGAGGEGDDRGWDGWMASPTQRTQTWSNSRTWWGSGKPGVLQSMGSWRVRHNLMTEQ